MTSAVRTPRAWVGEGVDLKTAQSRLGHSDPRFTLALLTERFMRPRRQRADGKSGRL